MSETPQEAIERLTIESLEWQVKHKEIAKELRRLKFCSLLSWALTLPLVVLCTIRFITMGH